MLALHMKQTGAGMKAVESDCYETLLKIHVQMNLGGDDKFYHTLLLTFNVLSRHLKGEIKYSGYYPSNSQYYPSRGYLYSTVIITLYEPLLLYKPTQ